MWERRVTVRREGTELGQHEIGAEERLLELGAVRTAVALEAPLAIVGVG